MSRRTIAILCALLIALASTAVYLRFGNPLDPFDNRSFDPRRWARSNEDQRAEMARDLVEHHLPIGMPAAQITAMLGAADEVDESAGNGEFRAGVRLYSYWLGSNGYWDDAYVYIHLDAADRIVAAEIDGS